MGKVDIDSVEHTMRQAGVADKEVQQVIADLKAELEALKADKQKEPKTVSYNYIIANTDVPAGTPIDEYPMVVVKAQEEVPPDEIVDEIKHVIATANNDCKKLKKDPIKNIFDGIERVPQKFFKVHKISVVSKTTTQLLKTNNKLQ